MKNKDNLDSKKEKKVNKIKEQLARLREKLASENNPSFPPKPKFKKIKDKDNQAEAPKKAKEKKAIKKEGPKRKQKRKRIKKKKGQKIKQKKQKRKKT